jgi:glutathione S-transferase
MDFILKTLSASPYLLGDAFTGADVLYATTFALFGRGPLLPKSPVIDAYVKRCIERPAYERATAKENG